MQGKIKVAEALSAAGHDVWYEQKFYAIPDQRRDKPFRVDIWVPKHRIYVEIDGWRHTSSKHNMRKDNWKDEALESIGLRGIRVTLSEALAYPEQVVPRLPPATADVVSG